MLNFLDIHEAFKSSLSAFIPSLAQTSIQIANRLELFQKLHDLYEEPAQGVDSAVNSNLEVQKLQLDSILETPVVNSRGGLYVYINAVCEK